MVIKSSKSVQVFIDCLRAAINAGQVYVNVPNFVIIELLDNLRSEGKPNKVGPKNGIPALSHLQIAIRNARLGSSIIRDLADLSIRND